MGRKKKAEKKEELPKLVYGVWVKESKIYATMERYEVTRLKLSRDLGDFVGAEGEVGEYSLIHKGWVHTMLVNWGKK